MKTFQFQTQARAASEVPVDRPGDFQELLCVDPGRKHNEYPAGETFLSNTRGSHAIGGFR